MEGSGVECAGRRTADCGCGAGPSLAVLNDVHKAYEDRLELVEKVGGSRKVQMQVEVLRSWVGDLVGQNTLLSRAVVELEGEATARLLTERTRHAEKEGELHAEVCSLRRRLARKDSDLRGLVEVLRRLREFDYCTLDGIHFFEVTESDIFGSVAWRTQKLERGDSATSRRSPRHSSECRRNKHKRYFDKRDPISCSQMCNEDLINKNESLRKDNFCKEREIKRLVKDTRNYEQQIEQLRNDLSVSRCPPDKPKKDAQVMVQACCSNVEVSGFGGLLREEAAKLRQRMDDSALGCSKSGGTEASRALRKVNVALSEELHALRHVCAALDEQCRAAAQRALFKDDVIREMRRQLRQAKAKLKESESNSRCNSLSQKSKELSEEYKTGSSGALLRRRVGLRSDAPLHPDSDDCHTPALDGSGDDGL